MPLDPDLHRLRDSLDPASEARDRVHARIAARIQAPAMLREVRNALGPSDAQRLRVWARIAPALQGAASADLLERLRDWLSPSPVLSQIVWQRLRPSLSPAALPVQSSSGRILKWTAACALFALAVRVSPFLFIASPTIADSQVSFLITRGQAAISIAGLWQPVTGELTLEPGMMLRTHESEASILFHDDGVIRLGPQTVVTLHDTADRREPAPEVLPVLTLHTGRIWVQGLVPAHVRGLTIATAEGHVTVHEGSLSIAEEAEGIAVDVHNRRAVVAEGGEETVLVRGERTQLSAGALLVKKIAPEAAEDAWVAQNLARDAVHRREIAQLQQERRASQAGILPTSRLYPVKRAAERVDVLLTFGQQARVEKKIEHASVRLAEAAALLEEGKREEVAQPLLDYRETLTSVASGTGAGSVAQFLLQQAVSETSADVAAALPGDDSYLLKRAVLETSAVLPDGPLSDREVRAEILADTLTALTDATEGGELANLSDAMPFVEEALMLLESPDADLAPEIRKETQATLGRLAIALADQAETGTGSTPVLEAVAAFLPRPPAPAVPQFTDEQIAAITQGIWDRMYVYGMPQSRKNQLTLELAALQGHPEEGRILRDLYQTIPGGSDLHELVRKAIVELRWQKAAE